MTGLIVAALVGLDTEVVLFLVACLNELGPQPTIVDIAEVLAPFVSELELPPDRAAALSRTLAVALRDGPEPKPKPEPEPEPEPELERVAHAASRGTEDERAVPSAESETRSAKQTRLARPQQQQPQHRTHQQRPEPHRSLQQHQQPQQRQQRPQRLEPENHLHGKMPAQHPRRQTRPDPQLVQQPQACAEQQRRSQHAMEQLAAPTGVRVRARQVEQMVAESAAVLDTCSLSEQQRTVWESLSLAVAAATPCPRDAKRGPPDAIVLAAMQSARQTRDVFVAGLGSTQKEDVARLLDCEKRERKLRSKEETARFKAERTASSSTSTTAEAGAGSSAEPVLTAKQKEVMTRAFWLFQKDRKGEHIDSTEWKRARALGSASPMLCSYVKRAGWDPTWPDLQPEGRLLRREGTHKGNSTREGQQAALKKYTR